MRSDHTARGYAPTAWDVSFDVFQRCAATAHLIRSVKAGRSAARLRILDVGAGRTPFLARFLPDCEFELFFTDKEAPTAMWGEQGGYFVKGDALSLPFAGGSFDCVCCVDVLEHLRAEDRHRALDEMVRVSRGSLMVVAPCLEDDVRLHEETANSAYRAYFGKGHPRLDEHLREPLPSERELRQYLSAQHGLQAQVFHNGYLPRWQEMIMFSLILYGVPELREYAALVNRFYNETLYPYDNKGPAYRRIIVLGAEQPLSLPCRSENADYLRHCEHLRSYLRTGYHLLTVAGSRTAAEGRSEAEIASFQATVASLTEGKGRNEAEIASLQAAVASLTEDKGRNEVEIGSLRATVASLTEDKERALAEGKERGEEVEALQRALEYVAQQIWLIEKSERWIVGGALVKLYHRLRLRAPKPDAVAKITDALHNVLAREHPSED